MISSIKHSSSVEKIKIASTARLLDKSSIEKLSRSIDELRMKNSMKRLPVEYGTKRQEKRGNETPPEYKMLENMSLFKGKNIESF